MRIKKHIAVWLCLFVLLTPALPAWAADEIMSVAIEHEGDALVYVDHEPYILKLLAELKDSTTKKDVTGAATWTTSNSAVIKVDGGVLTAVSPGSATITAKYQTFTATIFVTSKYVYKEIYLEPSTDLHVELGDDSKVIQAYAVEHDGSVQRITEHAQWSSSDASIVKVDKGELELIGAGTATITAKYKGLSKKTKVHVTSPYSGMTITPSADYHELQVGDTPLQLKAFAELKGGMTEDVSDEAEWLSSNTAVATVEEGKIKPVGQGTAKISAKYLGVSAEVEVIVRLPYEAMVVTPQEEIHLFLTDDPVQLKAEVLKGTAFREDVTSKAKWTSSNPVAVMVNHGKITPHAAGTSTIEVSYRGFTQGIPVYVYPTVTNIKMEDDEIELFKKEVGTLPMITGEMLNGEEVDVTELAEWTTSNDKIVKIEEGQLIAGMTGTAYVTASLKGFRKQVKVNVREKVLDLQATVSEVGLIVGTHQQLPRINALFEDGKKMDVSEKIQWEASSPNLLVEDGQMKALLASKVTLTGTYLNKKISIPVVMEEEIIRFEFMSDVIELNPGKSATIRVTGYDKNYDYTKKATTLTNKIEWTSSEPSVAEVKGSKVKALKEGTALLTGQYQGKTLQVKVQVVPKLKSITLSESRLRLQPGEASSLVATAVYDNGKAVDITRQGTWMSTNESIVTVDQGKVKAIQKGTVSVRVTFGGKTKSIRVQVK